MMRKLFSFFIKSSFGFGIGIVLILGIYLYSGFSHQLLSPDEVRYVGISNMMAHANDWWIPTINSSPFFHKPPLFYWITIAAIKYLGHNLIAYRMASILATLLIIWGWHRFIKLVAGVYFARLVAYVLAFSLPMWLASQYANTDQLVASMINLTVLFGAEVAIKMNQGKSHKPALYLMYLFAAFGLLAKGLIGVALPGAILLAWLVVTQPWRYILKYFAVLPILLFVLVGLGPLIYIETKVSGYLYYFFVEQQFLRFLSPGHFNNVQPVYFYLPLIAVSSLPWLVLIWTNRKAKLRKLFSQTQPEAEKTENPATQATETEAVPSLEATEELKTTDSALVESADVPQEGKDSETTETLSETSQPPVPVISNELTIKVWNSLIWLSFIGVVIITGFFSIPKSKLVGYILPAVPFTVTLILLIAYRNYVKLGLNFKLIAEKVDFTRLFTGMSAFFAVTFVGLVLSGNKLTKSSINLKNSKGEVFSLTTNQTNPDEVVIYSLGRYPYGFSIFYDYYKPLIVLLDLDKPYVRLIDSWHKEIYDGIAYKPELKSEIFDNPFFFANQMCDQNLLVTLSNQPNRLNDYLAAGKTVYLISNNISQEYLSFALGWNQIRAYQEILKSPQAYKNKHYTLIQITPEVKQKFCQIYQDPYVGAPSFFTRTPVVVNQPQVVKPEQATPAPAPTPTDPRDHQSNNPLLKPIK